MSTNNITMDDSPLMASQGKMYYLCYSEFFYVSYFQFYLKNKKLLKCTDFDVSVLYHPKFQFDEKLNTILNSENSIGGCYVLQLKF